MHRLHPCLIACCLSDVPAEYYHEETEKERQLLEVITTLQNNNDFKALPNVKVSLTYRLPFSPLFTCVLGVQNVLTWEDIQAAKDAPLETMPDPFSMVDPAEMRAFEPFSVDKEGNVVGGGATFSNVEALEDLDDELTEKRLEKRHNWRDIDEEMVTALLTSDLGGSLNLTQETQQNPLANDLPRKSPNDVINFTAAGLTSSPDEYEHNPDFPAVSSGTEPCPGKLQRRGKAGILRCAKIDLDELNFLDVQTLQHYLTVDAEIQHRKVTGLCAKCQRHVARTIKRARHMGILPHIGNFDIHEVLVDKEAVDRAETHTSVRVDKSYFRAQIHKK